MLQGTALLIRLSPYSDHHAKPTVTASIRVHHDKSHSCLQQLFYERAIHGLWTEITYHSANVVAMQCVAVKEQGVSLGRVLGSFQANGSALEPPRDASVRETREIASEFWQLPGVCEKGSIVTGKRPLIVFMKRRACKSMCFAKGQDVLCVDSHNGFQTH